MSSFFFVCISEHIKSKFILGDSTQKERPAEMPVFRKERN